MDARTQLALSRVFAKQAGEYAAIPEQAPMPVPVTCCQPCRQKDFCREDGNCCLECHFGFEEKLAFPYLPPEGREILAQQHRWLMANKMPRHEVEAHAAYEMEWFRAYCPPEIVAQIEADHEEYDAGGLPSRDDPPMWVTPLPQPELALPPIPVPVAEPGTWVAHDPHAIHEATMGVAHGYVGATALGRTGFRTR